MKHAWFALMLAMVTLAKPPVAAAQVDEDQLGAWYMYFWGTRFNDSQWGLQGDVQYRNWDLGGDLEQLLIRGGLPYTRRCAVHPRLCQHHLRRVRQQQRYPPREPHLPGGAAAAENR